MKKHLLFTNKSALTIEDYYTSRTKYKSYLPVILLELNLPITIFWIL